MLAIVGIVVDRRVWSSANMRQQRAVEAVFVSNDISFSTCLLPDRSCLHRLQKGACIQRSTAFRSRTPLARLSISSLNSSNGAFELELSPRNARAYCCWWHGIGRAAFIWLSSPCHRLPNVAFLCHIYVGEELRLGQVLGYQSENGPDFSLSRGFLDGEIA